MKPRINNDHDENSYLLPTNKLKAALQPLVNKSTLSKSSPTAKVIRNKIDAAFINEPDAEKELIESKEAGQERSKHQNFMYSLSNSGRPLADIQAAWHEYYLGLTTKEKHEVWNEFYAASGPKTPDEPLHKQKTLTTVVTKPHTPSQHKTSVAILSKDGTDRQTISMLKDQLLEKVRVRAHAKPIRSRLHSLFFGLAVGSVMLLIMLFGLFNERFIAPFITPSRSVSATPIIIDPNSTSVGPESTVIIPKINVEIPVVYDEPTINESAIQRALERGTVHYPTTPNPGEVGNTVIFGHSSNNILNKGKYKFAFVLLSKLENGDIFYLTKDGKRYAYRVYEKRIVKPSQVEVLGATEKPATATLITCDPPGTSLNRLVVIGEQITPDPTVNISSTASSPTEPTAVLPSNSPSLWDRITGWF